MALQADSVLNKGRQVALEKERNIAVEKTLLATRRRS
jgi:hypothetical protein